MKIGGSREPNRSVTQQKMVHGSNQTRLVGVTGIGNTRSNIEGCKRTQTPHHWGVDYKSPQAAKIDSIGRASI